MSDSAAYGIIWIWGGLIMLDNAEICLKLRRCEGPIDLPVTVTSTKAVRGWIKTIIRQRIVAQFGLGELETLCVECDSIMCTDRHIECDHGVCWVTMLAHGHEEEFTCTMNMRIYHKEPIARGWFNNAQI